MSTPRSLAPIGVLLALVAGLQACRAREGDRCACAEDCRDGLSCVAAGRVLEAGECTPVAGDNATPGVCVDEDEAAEDDGGGPPEVFMDLGAKRDFDPGLPPDTASGSGSGSSGGSETGVATEGTSTGEATGSSSSEGSGTSTGGSGSSTGGSGTTTGAT